MKTKKRKTVIADSNKINAILRGCIFISFYGNSLLVHKKQVLQKVGIIPSAGINIKC
jgi:hypothetical protein